MKKILILIVCLTAVAGCGRKGLPVAPRHASPPPVNDLSYRIDNGLLELRWTAPVSCDKKRPVYAGFVIYRSRISPTDNTCPNCPRLFQTVTEVPVDAKCPATDRGLEVSYSESLEGYGRYAYKVVPKTGDPVLQPESNTVEFEY